MAEREPTDEPEALPEILDALLKERASDAAGLLPGDAERWLAEHPDRASDLRASLEVMGDLDRAVAAGLVGSGAHSVLSRLAPSVRPPSRPVLLREEADAGPALLSSSSRATVEGRYQIAGEIARGGMGVVLKGYDVDLAREVAVKVLREDHADRPDLVRRFVEEAQIGGQLQHPGIAPVHDVGVDAAQRPYFVMKLVRGRTLSALLAERSAGARDPAPFLPVFSSVCQTVAYAHSRGVIHRDLKPSNVMVGSFGEVLVLDWGMGKVLSRGGADDDARTRSASEARPVRTVRSGTGGGGSDTQVGSAMGTGPYMSPEQARGENDALDERTDVFGLGAILCEVLTGSPPYRGTAQEVLAMAHRGDLADAHARLAACGADAALVALARRCLAPARDDRPRDGAAVAREVASHLASVEERRRAAETDLARAEVRVGEERRRRRLSLALSAAVLALVTLAGGGWVWTDAQRRARLEATDRLVSESIDEATRLRAESGDADGWAKALAAARRAEAVSRDREASPATRDRAVRALADVESGAAAAESARRQAEDDRRLVERLEGTRLSLADHFLAGAARREYREALSDHGLDPLTSDPNAYASRLRDAIRLPVLLAIGDWREKLRMFGHPTDALDAVLDACDPDPLRARLRATPTIDELRELASAAASADHGVESLLALGERLRESDPERALALALRAWSQRPDDFWANYYAASWARGCRPRRLGEALRYASAAVSLRPRSAAAWDLLGRVLLDRDELAEAEEAVRRAIRLQPKEALFHFDLGVVRRRRGDVGAGEVEVRKALELRPAYAEALEELGDILGRRGDAAGEEKAYRDAVAAAPENASVHDSLGTALFKRGNLAEAEAEHREALRLDPRLSKAHSNLGNVLDAMGRIEEAVDAYREAIRLHPDSAAHFNLGITLWNRGNLDGAERALRESTRLGLPYARAALGNVLLRKGDLAAAEVEIRGFLRARPEDTDGRYLLGSVLQARGEFDAAEAQFRDLIRDLRGASGSSAESPLVVDGANAHLSGDGLDIPDVYTSLADVLQETGNPAEAEAVCREAVEALPTSTKAWLALGTVLANAGRSSEAVDALRRCRDLDPTWSDSAADKGIAAVEGLDRRGERILAGHEKPRDAADALVIWGWLKTHGHRRAAADLSEAAVRQGSPEEAPDLLYDAACYAALAATAVPPEEPEDRRAARRAAAVSWLEARLRHLERAPRARRWEVVRELRRWQRDPDLAGLRGPDALARLPAEERPPLEALWAEVERIAVDRAAP